MRKMILSVAVLAIAGFTTVKANTVKTAPVAITFAQQEDVKTPVKLGDLPDAVKKTLASDDYKDWTPSAASHVKTAKGAEYFEISLKKGEESKVVNLDKDGKVVA